MIRRRPASLIAVLAAGAVVSGLASGCSSDPAPARAASSATPAPETTSASPTASPSPSPTDPVAACVAEVTASMTGEQRRGQLLMVGFDTNAPLDALDELVAERHVGNVIYLGGWDGAAKVTRTSRHLQGLVSESSTAEVGLLVAADQEGGEVHQLRGDGFTRPPSAKDQARMTPARLTEEATAWARQLKATGVNVNLAPVTDTVPADIGRDNEPIGKYGRQYGSTPDVVERAS
ncbi:MAG: glycoside hydrolase family 3 N-terminal domain-containing protein, partial [Phycicoccus sp.]